LIEVAWSFATGLGDRVETELEHIVADGLCLDGAIAASEAQRANMWRLREGQSAAASRLGYILRSDVAVEIGKLPDLLRWTAAAQGRLDGQGIRVLPFGHVGDGNLHVNYVIPFDASNAALHERLLAELYDEVDRLGGSISAEHGVGRAKRQAVAARKPARLLAAEHQIKTLFDPDNILNPGVVLGKPESSS
jgi:FAD/FMN-containing dehydrogenase